MVLAIGIAILKKSCPDSEIRVITEGQAVTQEYNRNRVNIVSDNEGIIQRVYRG